MIGNMVQYSVLPNCTNHCDFCLCKDKRVLSANDIVKRIHKIRENINHIDWVYKFRNGISLLGGEVYGFKDPLYEKEYLLLVDDICEKILKKSPAARYSTVTNGIYTPEFLFACIDSIVKKCSIKQADVNFSYDIKYRYHTEHVRKLALQNINAFRKRYNYCVGVQMILTEYVIQSVFNNKWSIRDFIDKDIPGNQLVFLYPHPIRSQNLPLNDFFFRRSSFLKFLVYLEKNFPDIHYNTIMSTKNSGTFKYTGLYKPEDTVFTQPILADGKEVLQDCGHSVLYKCYSDSDNCMLCDIENMYGKL